MEKIIVIDFDYEENFYKALIEDIENVQYVNYYDAISDLDEFSMVELKSGYSYDSIIIINPDISKLSRISRLISINILEDLILDHLLQEKEIFIDFRKLNELSHSIKSDSLRKKLCQIIIELKSLGVLDIAEVIKNKSLKNKVVSIKNQNIFITERDIRHLAKGDDLILNSNEKLTPLAKDFIKTHRINIIRKSVGE